MTTESRTVGWRGEHAPGERRLASLFNRLDTQRRALEGMLALKTADLRLLWLFADGHARTLREVADELGLEQSTVNRQVNAALGAGLLERSRREGGPSYQFLRTQAGREAFERDAGLSLGAYATALGEMGDDDAEEFLALAERFLGHFADAVNELAG